MMNPGGANDVGVLGVLGVSYFKYCHHPAPAAIWALSLFQIRPVDSMNLSRGYSEPHPYIMGPHRIPGLFVLGISRILFF